MTETARQRSMRTALHMYLSTEIELYAVIAALDQRHWIDGDG
jgi:hypothetical protein